MFVGSVKPLAVNKPINSNEKKVLKNYVPAFRGAVSDVVDIKTAGAQSDKPSESMARRLKKAGQLIQDLGKIIEDDLKRDIPVLKRLDNGTLEKIFNLALQDRSTPVMIGVAGGSASGKTTIAEGLSDRLNQNSNQVNKKPFSELVSQDNYYKDFSDEIKEKGADRVFKEKNLDCPDAVDLSLLAGHLDQLKGGKDVKIPEFLPNGTGVSKPDKIPVSAAPFVFVEGLFTLTTEKLRDLFDLKVFVDASKEVRADRWWKRAAKRNIKNDEAGKAFFNRTFKMHDIHVEPSKAHADIVLNSEAEFSDVNLVLDQIARAISKPVSFAGLVKLVRPEKKAA
jgi:uridine kinase